MEAKFYTDYATATKWLHNNMILCNNIVSIDENYEQSAPYEDEDGDYTEIYQFYLTDCSEWDADYLRKTFGLNLGYSPLMDMYVLEVTHYGTSWDYVPCPCYDEECSAKHYEH